MMDMDCQHADDLLPQMTKEPAAEYGTTVPESSSSGDDDNSRTALKIDIITSSAHRDDSSTEEDDDEDDSGEEKEDDPAPEVPEPSPRNTDTLLESTAGNPYTESARFRLFRLEHIKLGKLFNFAKKRVHRLEPDQVKAAMHDDFWKLQEMLAERDCVTNGTIRVMYNQLLQERLDDIRKARGESFLKVISKEQREQKKAKGVDYASIILMTGILRKTEKQPSSSVDKEIIKQAIEKGDWSLLGEAKAQDPTDEHPDLAAEMEVVSTDDASSSSKVLSAVPTVTTAHSEDSYSITEETSPVTEHNTIEPDHFSESKMNNEPSKDNEVVKDEFEAEPETVDDGGGETILLDTVEQKLGSASEEEGPHGNGLHATNFVEPVSSEPELEITLPGFQGVQPDTTETEAEPLKLDPESHNARKNWREDSTIPSLDSSCFASGTSRDISTVARDTVAQASGDDEDESIATGDDESDDGSPSKREEWLSKYAQFGTKFDQEINEPLKPFLRASIRDFTERETACVSKKAWIADKVARENQQEPLDLAVESDFNYEFQEKPGVDPDEAISEGNLSKKEVLQSGPDLATQRPVERKKRRGRRPGNMSVASIVKKGKSMLRRNQYAPETGEQYEGYYSDDTFDALGKLADRGNESDSGDESDEDSAVGRNSVALLGRTDEFDALWKYDKEPETTAPSDFGERLSRAGREMGRLDAVDDDDLDNISLYDLIDNMDHQDESSGTLETSNVTQFKPSAPTEPLVASLKPSQEKASTEDDPSSAVEECKKKREGRSKTKKVKRKRTKSQKARRRKLMPMIQETLEI